MQSDRPTCSLPGENLLEAGFFDRSFFLFPGQAFDPGFAFLIGRTIGTGSGVYQPHRTAGGGILTPLAPVMIFDPLVEIGGDPGVEHAVAAADDVDVPAWSWIIVAH